MGGREMAGHFAVLRLPLAKAFIGRNPTPPQGNRCGCAAGGRYDNVLIRIAEPEVSAPKPNCPWHGEGPGDRRQFCRTDPFRMSEEKWPEPKSGDAWLRPLSPSVRWWSVQTARSTCAARSGKAKIKGRP